VLDARIRAAPLQLDEGSHGAGRWLRERKDDMSPNEQRPSKPDLSDLRIDGEARARNGSGRRILVVAAVVLVAAATITVLVAGRGRPVEVQVAVAREARADAAATVLNASGYVEPRRRATVSSKITGKVTEVLVEEGMEVEAGQVLARLDDSDVRRRYDAIRAERDVARAALEEIEVNLADARRTLRRTLDLQAKGVSSQQALDSATAAVDGLEARLVVARASLEAAEAQLAVIAQDLENYTVRAPFAGVAVSKDAQPGEMVSPVSAGGGFTRTGISTIVDMDSLEIEVDVNESYIANVFPGQPAEAVLDAYPDWNIPATVRTVIPTADRQKATVKVRLTFNRLDPRILPDMGVKVAFQELQPDQQDAPAAQSVVPSAALRSDGGRSVVFVLAGDRLERRAVTAGRTLGADVEIVAGVAPGEQVVVDGPEQLVDGQAAKAAT
jgi:RND family efflux transporter MFP subunit